MNSVKKFYFIVALLAFGMMTLLSGYTTFNWTGATSTDWSNAGNWDQATYPNTDLANCIIPSAPLNQPVMSEGITVRSVDVNSGASLDMNGNDLTISSDSYRYYGSELKINGTFTQNGGFLVLNPHKRRGEILLYATSLDDVEIDENNADSKVLYMVASDLNISGNFDMYSSTMSMGDQNLVVAGHLSLTAIEAVNSVKMTGPGTEFTPPSDYLDIDFIVNSAGTVTIANQASLQCTKVSVEAGTLYMGLNGIAQVNLNVGQDGLTTGSIDIDNGATLTAKKAQITIYDGDLTVNGTYAAEASGSGKLHVTRGTISGGGTIDAGDAEIELANDWFFSGTFTKGTSNVTFDQAIDISKIYSGTSFYNLTFLKTNSYDVIEPTTAGGIVTFTNTLTYTRGYFFGGLRYIGTDQSMDVSNYLSYTRGSAGNITITKYTGSTATGAVNAIENYIVVNSANAVSDIGSYYVSGGDNDELSTGFSNDAGDLKTWRKTSGAFTKMGGSDSGSKWSYANASAVSAGISTTLVAMDDDSGSLPVEFDEERFYANSVKEGVELTWLTHSETGLKGFIIYRSLTADGIFEEYDSWESNNDLMTKNEGGFSTFDTNYDYIDEFVTEGEKYYYQISAYCSEEDNEFHPKTVSSIFNGENEVVMSLGQNFPNPFNPETKISYFVGSSTNVSIKLYNSVGQMVKEIENKYRSAGSSYTISLTNEDLSSGIYYYQMKTGNGFNMVKKMMVVK